MSRGRADRAARKCRWPISPDAWEYSLSTDVLAASSNGSARRSAVPQRANLHTAQDERHCVPGTAGEAARLAQPYRTDKATASRSSCSTSTVPRRTMRCAGSAGTAATTRASVRCCSTRQLEGVRYPPAPREPHGVGPSRNMKIAGNLDAATGSGSARRPEGDRAQRVVGSAGDTGGRAAAPPSGSIRRSRWSSCS